MSAPSRGLWHGPPGGSGRRTGQPAGTALSSGTAPPPPFEPPPEEAVDVHQLRSGHWGRSEQYLHRIGRRPTPECAQCDDKECPAAAASSAVKPRTPRRMCCWSARACTAPGSVRWAISSARPEMYSATTWWRPWPPATRPTRAVYRLRYRQSGSQGEQQQRQQHGSRWCTCHA